MSILLGHRRAARHLANAMRAEAGTTTDSVASRVLFALGHAYDQAANSMEAEEREAAGPAPGERR
jgi:hypothetical protein